LPFECRSLECQSVSLHQVMKHDIYHDDNNNKPPIHSFIIE